MNIAEENQCASNKNKFGRTLFKGPMKVSKRIRFQENIIITVTLRNSLCYNYREGGRSNDDSK